MLCIMTYIMQCHSLTVYLQEMLEAKLDAILPNDDSLSHANSHQRPNARAPATSTSSIQNLLQVPTRTHAACTRNRKCALIYMHAMASLQVRTRDVKAAEEVALKAWAQKRARQTAAAKAAAAALKRRAAKQASNAAILSTEVP